MTNQLAIVLAALILGFFAVDHFVLHLGAPMFLAHKFDDLIEWVAFWR